MAAAADVEVWQVRTAGRARSMRRAATADHDDALPAMLTYVLLEMHGLQIIERKNNIALILLVSYTVSLSNTVLQQ